MDQQDPFEDLLNLLLEIKENNDDEIDGVISFTGIVRKINQVIKITLKIINQLIETFVSCVQEPAVIAQAEKLAEITSSLVNITILVNQLIEQDGGPSQH